MSPPPIEIDAARLRAEPRRDGTMVLYDDSGERVRILLTEWPDADVIVRYNRRQEAVRRMRRLASAADEATARLTSEEAR